MGAEIVRWIERQPQPIVTLKIEHPDVPDRDCRFAARHGQAHAIRRKTRCRILTRLTHGTDVFPARSKILIEERKSCLRTFR